MSSGDRSNVTTLASYCDQSIKANHISSMTKISCAYLQGQLTQFFCMQMNYIPL
jgi:hypothetical protein